MSSTKCSKCGLTNFVSAEHCKRCKASLVGASTPNESGFSPAPAPIQAPSAKSECVFEDAEPRRPISPLRILVLVLLVVGVTWFLIQKEETERAAEVKAAREFDQKRRSEDEKAQMGRDQSERARWAGPASTRP
jgi:hypothetical protein